MAALLALVTIALYWPATGYDFVNYDDPDFVTANPHVQSGLSWEGVRWAFGNTQQAVYWAPVTWLSHMLVCQVFGLHPWGHHLVNVLLHATNTALLFLLLRRITGATWRCLVVAALFGLHPLRVESVAWVTERKDVLSGLFFFLTLWSYVRYAEGRMQNAECRTQNPEVPSPASRITHHVSGFRFQVSGFYLLSLLFFALGLLSKPMLVTLPCVLLLLDYWPLQRFDYCRARSLVMEKIPFFALALAASLVTFMVQSHGGAVMGGGSSGSARAPETPSSGTAGTWRRCSGRLTWRCSIRTPDIGRWGRCCWRVVCSWAFRCCCLRSDGNTRSC